MPHRHATTGQNEGLPLLTQRQREAKSNPVSKHFQGYPTVAKAELGTKRVCPVTGRKFYDLNKDPVVSPYTGEIVPITVLPVSRRGAHAAAPVAPAMRIFIAR